MTGENRIKIYHNNIECVSNGYYINLNGSTNNLPYFTQKLKSIIFYDMGISNDNIPMIGMHNKTSFLNCKYSCQETFVKCLK